MLITFSSPAYADITMFGEPAKRLLRMMGHRGQVPGALVAEEVPAALERLKAALEAEQQRANEANEDQEAQEALDEDQEAPIGIAKRAVPVVEMLEAAARDEVEVMWDSQT